MDIRKELAKGQALQDQAHKDLEVSKRGNLRGGSAGVVGTDGKIYGECHRLSLARLLGVEKETDSMRHIMFDAGNAIEDSWARKLFDAGLSFLREEETPISYTIPGTAQIVTGRPDFVVTRDKSGEIVDLGIELKGIFSASSAVRVAVEGLPDPKHLAQAGFYSMALGIDYALCYTNPSVWDSPYWAIKKLGAPKKIQPFYHIFYLRWTDVLEYKDEHKEEWVRTVYTKEGIADYYRLVVEMQEQKNLGPRPEGGYADGREYPFYKCDYCPLNSICDMFESDYDNWVKTLKEKT
jgi:hypothetical protein